VTVIYSVKITVIKKSFDEDLAKMYLTDGIEAGACPIFEVGNQYIIGDEFEAPSGFCTWAWQDIFYVVHTLRNGGSFDPWINRKGAQVVCCSDAVRPICFLIERIEKSE